MDRRVKAIKKNRSGDITALCNPDESWSPRRVADVISDIRRNERSYYVQEQGRRVYIRLRAGGVLQTTPDKSSVNSLANLPSL